MTFRIGWVSPLTPTSGVGTFSHAITSVFPDTFGGEAIDLTLLHSPHAKLHDSRHRCLAIADTPVFHQVLSLFDLLIYNIGNNREHHDVIFRLLRLHPGVVICHDYVYQHYLADQSLSTAQNFLSYAALLMKYADKSVSAYIRRSRITSRTGGIRYSPWDSEYSVQQPMSEVIAALGSALVVHSDFAHRSVAATFAGPILKLGMPHDQKTTAVRGEVESWERSLSFKATLHLVSFGHIQSTKCIDMVIEAIAASQALRRGMRYTVAGFIGDETYFEQCRQRVASAGLREIVTFETGVGDTRLAELMRDADLFINLRKPNTEGSSASLIEQLEAARPVVVLDSGCYAEIEATAAIKLPVDATSLEIRTVLERYIGKRELLPPIARAGQAYARTWSCRSYGRHLVDFLGHHRDLLMERAKAVAIHFAPGRPESEEGEQWRLCLAKARASLCYVDTDMLALDPEIILGQTGEDLSAYVAHVIFGVFDRPGLQPALLDLFAMKRGQAAYWACVKLALIADVIFQGKDAARERLSVMTPCYDVAFWRVIQALSPAHYCAAATCLLGPLSAAYRDEAALGGDDGNVLLAHSQLGEIVGALPTDPAIADLKIWFEQPPPPQTCADFLLIDRDMTLDVGSAEFRHIANLSGFHRMEADHAWMQGLRGFIGLRLGAEVIGISMLVRQIHGDADDPCVLRLSSGATSTMAELRTHEALWVTLDMSSESSRADPITWVQISTNQAMAPRLSDDKRTLGACLMRLRVRVAPAVSTSTPMRRTLVA